jgi:hypothetical protein
MTGLEWLKAHLDYDGAECLIWPKCRADGYGRVGVGKGKLGWAHRVMCELVHGPAPEGYEAAHSCGRGKFGCVHPKHVSWKTPSQNQYERRQHGTHGKRKGVRYHLTPEQVSEIRALRGFVPQRLLGKIFDVAWQTIGNIQRSETWKTGTYAGGLPRSNSRVSTG